MSYLYKPVLDRVAAILFEARGATGMTADAALRSIPVGYYRRCLAPLRDPAVSAQQFHRGAYLKPQGEVDGIPPSAGVFDMEEQDLTLDVEVGYYHALAQSVNVHVLPSTSDDASDVVRNARMVAMSDGDRMRRALMYYELFGGALDAAGTTIIDVSRTGPIRIDELPDGKLLATHTFLLKCWVSNVATYTP